MRTTITISVPTITLSRRERQALGSALRNWEHTLRTAYRGCWPSQAIREEQRALAKIRRLLKPTY